MKIQLDHRPSYSSARVDLDAGEAVKTEPGAMMAIRGDVAVETSSGGLLKGLKRSMLGGESFFQNIYTAGAGGGSIYLVPAAPGDLWNADMGGRSLIVQQGSYLASHPELDVDAKYTGWKGRRTGESNMMLRIAGHGQLILSSFGAIEQHQIESGEAFCVDTGHIVAYAEGMAHEVERIGNWKSTIFSGEGWITRFQGPGTVWTQSRSLEGLATLFAQRQTGGDGQQENAGVAGIVGSFLR